MPSQPLFTEKYVYSLIRKLDQIEGVNDYLQNRINIEQDEVITNIHIEEPDSSEVTLLMPQGTNRSQHDFHNAKLIYEAYRTLTPTQATDQRIWAYLAHVTFFPYMQRRFPISEQPEEKRPRYIWGHWFIRTSSPRGLIDHGIASLWWIAHHTYDSTRNDPYELTQEVFQMLDYTRTIVQGTLGRSRVFAHALLEYVLENEDLFREQKAAKVRYLMRKMNLESGYKILTVLSKDAIKKRFENYRKEISEAKREDISPMEVG